MRADLKQQTISGIGWSAAARFTGQLVSFAVFVLLARLLTPDDFGLVGMVAVLTGFAAVFGESGLGVALVQRRELTPRHLDSTFWAGLLVGLGLLCAVVALGPALAEFYRGPRLAALAALIAVNLLLGSFDIVHRALLERAMRFRSLAWVEGSSIFVSGAVAVALAAAGYGVWSLVWQMLVLTAVRVLGMWGAAAWRPRPRFDWPALRELLGFSGNLVGFRVFSYWIRNADQLLIGKLVGSQGLGIYSRATSILLLPLRDVTSVLGRVMVPALSRIQDDRRRVRTIYLRAIASVAMVTVPMMAGLGVVSKAFVLALFGPQWEAMIPILQILCAVGLIQPIHATTGWLYISQGRTDWQFRWGIAAGVVTLLAFGIGIHWGMTGLALAYLFRVYALSPLQFSIPGRLVGMRFADVVRALGGIFGCAAGMAAAVWTLGWWLPAGFAPWARLAVQVPVGALIYALLVHVFGLDAYRGGRALLAEQRRAGRGPWSLGAGQPLGSESGGR